MDTKKITIIIMCVTAFLFGGKIWIETTQDDFADGSFEHNLYSSNVNGGTLKFIPSFDVNGDGYVDIFISNRLSHCTYIYWGGAAGYSTSNRTVYQYAGTGGNCDAADLDGDGYPDFVCAPLECNGLYIYWGSSAGPNPNSPTILPIPSNWNESNYLADLNKDGYIDVITGNQQTNQACIFWGSDNGYSASNTTQLPTVSASHHIEIADLDKDNWLDIVFVNDYAASIYIYWGSSAGFSSGDCQILANVGLGHGFSIADLDDNGFLDLILTNRTTNVASIYYGNESGYSNYVTVNPGQGNGSGYGGSSIADFDNDGFLDIVFFTVGNPLIYWGSASGFSDADRTTIPVQVWTSSGFVCDLNGDSYLDILLGNWGWDGTTHIVCGPSYTSSQSLGADYDHHAMFREIGNPYDRKYYEDYVSSVFNAGEEANWETIEWDAAAPAGALVLFWLRSGNTPIPDVSWSEWVQVDNYGGIPENLNARYLQYKARLAYTNPACLPALEEVRVSYSTEPTPIIAIVRIEPETINLNSHGTFTAFIKFSGGINHGLIKLSTIECEGAHATSGMTTPGFYIARFNVQDLIGVMPGKAVEFMVTGELHNGTPFAGCDTVRVIGHDAVLLTCNPNPFRYSTTISYPGSNWKGAAFKIYTMDGRLVRSFCNLESKMNAVSAVWDRRDNSGRVVPSGVYIFQIVDGGFSRTGKVLVLD